MPMSLISMENTLSIYKGRFSISLAEVFGKWLKYLTVYSVSVSKASYSVEMLLNLIRELKTKNTGIIFVSHRLKEGYHEQNKH